MLFSSRSRALSLVWLFIPSLLWSLFLHIPALCIDPLIFPVIERRLSPKLVFFGRAVWVAIFAITLLMAWNIGPGTYGFYLREALPFTPKYVLGALCFATILLVWFVLTSDVSKKMGRGYTWVMSAGILLFFVKILVVSGFIYSPFIQQRIKSPILGNAHLLLSSLGGNANGSRMSTETPEYTFDSFVKHQKSLPPRVVLMLVESWGEKRDTLAALAGDIQSQGFQIIRYGLTSYRGSTLSGEFRELCGKYVLPSDDLMDEMGMLRCAPQYLAKKNYQVIGLHGYQSSFYARSTFWERFGIKTSVFADKLQNQPQCPGPFPGTCDESLIRKSIDMLDDIKDPAFVYILTLSSHEPLDRAALVQRGRYFNEIKIDHPTQLVTRRAISALLARLEEHRGAGCTLVYVAGDHQPPSASARGGIFETGKVPYLAFTQNCPANPAQDGVRGL
jgi:hypothetical protein